MNVIRLNEYLSGNRDAIEEILVNLGCTNIKYNASQNEFRCSRDYGKNPSAVRINVDTLRFNCFSTSERGSIYNFIMYKRDLTFPKALNWVTETLKLDKDKFSEQIILPFDGFYKKLLRKTDEPELTMTVYDDELLKKYNIISNLTFLQDGIDLKTQEFFKLGYDHDSNRITIPEWNINGELVGIMGRSNDPNIPHEYRWLPIIPCSRSYTLYGYHLNYGTIQQEQSCIITESEKGVMQMRAMGYKNGLATCTKTISGVQERYLKALRIKQIILAYDEGVPEEELRNEALKLKSKNSIYATRIGYIYDADHEILEKDSKNAPTDLGRKNFNALIKNHTKWI